MELWGTPFPSACNIDHIPARKHCQRLFRAEFNNHMDKETIANICPAQYPKEVGKQKRPEEICGPQAGKPMLQLHTLLDSA